MGDEIDETPEGLRVDLHVVPVRPTSHRAARALDRFGECNLDVLAHRVRPCGTEGAFEAGDAFYGKGAHVLRDVVSSCIVLRRQHPCFSSPPSRPRGSLSEPRVAKATFPGGVGFVHSVRGSRRTSEERAGDGRYSCNGVHADETISRKSCSRGITPSSAAMRRELATSTAGSPARRGPIFMGIARPVTDRATSITCLTLYPAPPHPRLYAPPA